MNIYNHQNQGISTKSFNKVFHNKQQDKTHKNILNHARSTDFRSTKKGEYITPMINYANHKQIQTYI